MENQLEIVAMVKKLPPFPSQVERILGFLNDEASDWKKVGKIILKDPVLAGRVLQIANSSFYGLQRKVKDIDTACAVLGVETLRSLVQTLVFLTQFRNGHENSLVDYDLLWRNNLRVACMAKVLASKRHHDSSIFFTAGLFHTFDLIIQDYYFENILQKRIEKHLIKVTAPKNEKIYRMINTDDWWIIAALLDYWHFPKEIVATFGKEPSDLAREIKYMLLISNTLIERSDNEGTYPEVIIGALFDFDQVDSALAETLGDSIQEGQKMYQDLSCFISNES